jgi:thioredoxin reductase (NADPH)
MEGLEMLIIGAGPIGLACGIACEKKGIKYRIVEKGTLVDSIYKYPLNMTFFSTSDRLEIGDVPFISHQPKPNRFEALEYYRRVALHWKLNISLYERVTHVAAETASYRVTTDKRQYLTRSIVVATGFYDIPKLMGVSGEDLPKVHHYYREPHPYFGQKLVVVGAANSAVDVALETWRKGADVTMVIRDPAIRDSVKYWVRPDIENRIRDGEIKAYFESEITEIRAQEVEILTPHGIINIENDFVLAMTGYLPDFNLLTSMGVEIGDDPMRTPIHDPVTMETNQPRIYLAGVICGGLRTNKWFIENSRDHADRIVGHFLANSRV